MLIVVVAAAAAEFPSLAALVALSTEVPAKTLKRRRKNVIKIVFMTRALFELRIPVGDIKFLFKSNALGVFVSDVMC